MAARQKIRVSLYGSCGLVMVILGVDVGSGFVEHEDTVGAQNGAREAHELTLA